MPFLTVSPECRFCMPAPESHHGVASLASFRKVMARSYLIRTVIQLSKIKRSFILFGSLTPSLIPTVVGISLGPIFKNFFYKNEKLPKSLVNRAFPTDKNFLWFIEKWAKI